MNAPSGSNRAQPTRLPPLPRIVRKTGGSVADDKNGHEKVEHVEPFGSVRLGQLFQSSDDLVEISELLSKKRHGPDGQYWPLWRHLARETVYSLDDIGILETSSRGYRMAACRWLLVHQQRHRNGSIQKYLFEPIHALRAHAAQQRGDNSEKYGVQEWDSILRCITEVARRSRRHQVPLTYGPPRTRMSLLIYRVILGTLWLSVLSNSVGIACTLAGAYDNVGASDLGPTATRRLVAVLLVMSLVQSLVLSILWCVSDCHDLWRQVPHGFQGDVWEAIVSHEERVVKAESSSRVGEALFDLWLYMNPDATDDADGFLTALRVRKYRFDKGFLIYAVSAACTLISIIVSLVFRVVDRVESRASQSWLLTVGVGIDMAFPMVMSLVYILLSILLLWPLFDALRCRSLILPANPSHTGLHSKSFRLFFPLLISTCTRFHPVMAIVALRVTNADFSGRDIPLVFFSFSAVLATAITGCVLFYGFIYLAAEMNDMNRRVLSSDIALHEERRGALSIENAVWGLSFDKAGKWINSPALYAGLMFSWQIIGPVALAGTIMARNGLTSPSASLSWIPTVCVLCILAVIVYKSRARAVDTAADPSDPPALAAGQLAGEAQPTLNI